MTKRVEAKNKICRRLGVNLWGRARNPIVKRDYPPGEHGSKRRKISGYGHELAHLGIEEFINKKLINVVTIDAPA